MPPLNISKQSNVRHFIHHPPSSSTIPIVKCTTIHPPSPCSSTIPIVKCTTLHPPCRLFIYYLNSQMYDTSSTIPLFIYYFNSQMYDTSSTIPPVHLLSQQLNVRHFIHHPPVHLLSQQSNVRHLIHHPASSSTIPIVKCTTLHPQSPCSSISIVKMYDTSSTIPPVHLLSQQSNVRHLIHHPPCSSTIPIVKCTTPHPPSRLFIYYPNSQIYDYSSTIPPVHQLSQQSNVRRFIHHTPSSSISIVKCTTIHPPSPCSSTIPIVKCTTLHPPSPLFICYPNSQMYDTSSTIPPFIYYPNSQMYDTSSTIPPFHLLTQQSNVRHFIHHPPVHLLSQQSNVRHLIHHPASSSTIPIVKCTTLHPQSPLFIYCLNSQMYDTSSTIPPPCSSTIPIVKCTTLDPPSPCSSTIPIVKCTTPHPPSRLFICYLNSQMYDTSSTIPPVHLLSQQSNVRHFIHHPPCSSAIPIVNCTTPHPPYHLHRLSQQSNVRHFIHHRTVLATIPIVKCTTPHPPNPPSSTIPIVNVRHFIHHPPSSPISIVKCTRFDPTSHSSSTIPIVKCTTLHPPSPLFIYYPNSQMYDASSTMPPLNISKQSNVRHFIHHPPSSSTIPIVKCTTIRQPSLLFINYPNSQMYDTSSTIPSLHLLS